MIRAPIYSPAGTECLTRRLTLGTLHENNTYKAIRISAPGYNLYYSVWCSNEHELYDMTTDPGQLHNLLSPDLPASAATYIAGLPLNKVVARLDTLLFVLKSCEGSVCREPWKALHPAGNVWTLADALSPRFDQFYETHQVRFQYNFCANGYLIEAEGPSWEQCGQCFQRDGLSWDLWV